MDHFHGITFALIANGEVLNLYDDPDAGEVEESRSRSRYVEAVNGSTFQVKINLTPQFNFYNMRAEHAVLFRIKIDGNIDRWKFVTVGSLQKAFSQTKLGGYTFTGSTDFCKETAQWMRTDFSFSSLVLSMPVHSISS